MRWSSSKREPMIADRPTTADRSGVPARRLGHHPRSGERRAHRAVRVRGRQPIDAVLVVADGFPVELLTLGDVAGPKFSESFRSMHAGRTDPTSGRGAAADQRRCHIVRSSMSHHATVDARPRRRLRVVAISVAVLLALACAATVRLFVWPALPTLPQHADAIIELGGENDAGRDAA